MTSPVATTGHGNGNGSGTSFVTTIPSTGGGHGIFVSLQLDGGGTCSGMTNSKGDTFIQIAVSTLAESLYHFFCPSCTAGATSVTATVSSGANGTMVVVEEPFPFGINVDKFVSTTVSAASWTTGNMALPLNATNVMYTSICHGSLGNGYAANGSWGALTGTGVSAGVCQNTTDGVEQFIERQEVTATGLYAGTGTANGGSTSMVVVCSLKRGDLPYVVQSSGLVAGTTAAIAPVLNGCQAGNTLIFQGCSQSSGAGSPTVGDSNGTMLLAVLNNGANSTGTNQQSGIWYEDNIASGTHTVTMTPAATIRPTQGLLTEWCGFNSAGSFDQKASNSGGTVQTLASGSTPATTVAGEVAIAVIGLSSSSGVANIAITDPPSGYSKQAVSNVTTSSATACEMCYQPGISQGATPSISYSWTDANSRASSVAIATFAPPATAQPPVPYPPMNNGGMVVQVCQ